MTDTGLYRHPPLMPTHPHDPLTSQYNPRITNIYKKVVTSYHHKILNVEELTIENLK